GQREVDGARHGEGAAAHQRLGDEGRTGESEHGHHRHRQGARPLLRGPAEQAGYKATLQALSADIQYPYIQNSKNHVQFAFSDWFQDYPAASDFLNILLGCGSIHPNSNSSPNIAQFCDKKIQADMDRAGKTGITDPAAGNDIWAQVDHDVTDQAPWVSMYNP